jgi:hypothetical protein
MSKRYKQTKMQERLNTPVEERKPLGKPMEPNHFWDMLTKTYSDSIETSNVMGREISIAVSNVSNHPEKAKYIKDNVALANCVDLICKDIVSHQDALKAIHAKQLNTTGSTDDPDDHMLVLALNGEYSDQVSKFNSVFLDTTKLIEEMLNEAESAYFNIVANKEKEQSDLIDPNVITDVEFKESVK